MKIRPAQLADSPSLARIQVDSYRSAYAGILPPNYLAHFTYEEQEQDWRGLLAEPEHAELLIAEDDAGQVQGYCLFGPEKDGFLPGAGEIYALHIRQGQQRQGIGTALLRAAAAELRQQGCPSLLIWVLSQNSARQFYEQLGGVWFAARIIDLDGPQAEETAYVWEKIERVLQAVTSCD